MMVKGTRRTRSGVEGWDITSPEAQGLHRCIQPGVQDCQTVSVYRLNLRQGSEYTLESGELEMNPVLIRGQARISGAGLEGELGKLDSFYIPGKAEVRVEALEDCVFYIGAAAGRAMGNPLYVSLTWNFPWGISTRSTGMG